MILQAMEMEKYFLFKVNLFGKLLDLPRNFISIFGWSNLNAFEKLEKRHSTTDVYLSLFIEFSERE